MLDLDKVKYVLFDFDDTLCIHTDRSGYLDELTYTADLFEEKPDIWTGSKSNAQMCDFIRELNKRGIPMGLCSAVDFCQHAENKIKWVCKQYCLEHIDNYCCCTADHKIDAMIILAERFGLERENILIVDDYYYVINRACKAGFQYATPMEIVNWINQLNHDKHRVEYAD